MEEEVAILGIAIVTIGLKTELKKLAAATTQFQHIAELDLQK
jgi:hypothetical protein